MNQNISYKGTLVPLTNESRNKARWHPALAFAGAIFIASPSGLIEPVPPDFSLKPPYISGISAASNSTSNNFVDAGDIPPANLDFLALEFAATQVSLSPKVAQVLADHFGELFD